MFKILVSDPLSEKGLLILEKEKDIKVDVKIKQPADVLKKIIKDYDALIIRSETKATADLIACADKLKVIGRAGVGLDNVDVASATKKGIIVMNTPGGNTISTAEHTMSMILALSRNIAPADASMKSGQWERKKFMGVELYGKALGIIGLGRIGSEVAGRCLSFGMRVLAYDPFLAPEKASDSGIEPADLKKIFSASDYITVHTPLTSDTRHLIGEKEIDMMKPGVRLINCARGGIMDEKAVLKGIESGKVAGAAFDVYEEEPPKNSPLVLSDKVLTTPHLGASTAEAQDNVALEVAQQVVDALLNRGIRNAINIPYIELKAWKVLRPYMILAEKMGMMQAQLAQGPIGMVSLEYAGEVAKHDIAAITTAFIKGLLTTAVGEMVNNVNAIAIARERDIKITESKTNQVEEFAHLITAVVKSGGKTLSISGALFANNQPRIVKIDGYYVDALPEGNMILISNKDVPGVVGQLGTLLGKNGINIAGMTFGRQKPSGRAISLCNVDSKISAELISQLKGLKDIFDAWAISL
ncbi:MAG: phosphoglycerate dehydrogenase [Candidatus Omnitrophica bacterium]|nr:phosphoglycerate dehydrogenase [Candidatus Omnitrophota bacterium]